MTLTLTNDAEVLFFSDLHLSENLQSAIDDMNFEKPSEIQAKSYAHIIEGIDIIAQAPTGSGKTCAYGIPLLEKINKESDEIQALILCPTRELVIQVHKEFDKLTKYMENVNVVSIYGGQRIERQLDALKRNPKIIVATPGRLMDHLRRNSISLKNISMAVLDEADEMLDMGFREDIYTILSETPENRQTILFSATMAKDIIALTKKFQKSPLIIDVTDNLLNAPDIEQFYYEVAERDKPELITRLLESNSLQLALIFCNTKSNVDKLVEILKTRGYFADALHGDMNQAQREKVMRGFRNGSVKILVATDVAGRGIDVKNVQGVFNYDLPRDDEDYIHRIGRTGRAGKSGAAFTFISKKQFSSLKRIEKANGLMITKKECPTADEVDSSKVENYLKNLKDIVKNEDLTRHKTVINSLVDENNSLLDIAAALYKLSLDEQLEKINRNIVFEEEVYEEKEKRNRRRHSGSAYGSRGRNQRKDRNSDKPKKFEKNESERKVKDIKSKRKQMIEEMVLAVKSCEGRAKKSKRKSRV